MEIFPTIPLGLNGLADRNVVLLVTFRSLVPIVGHSCRSWCSLPEALSKSPFVIKIVFKNRLDFVQFLDVKTKAPVSGKQRETLPEISGCAEERVSPISRPVWNFWVVVEFLRPFLSRVEFNVATFYPLQPSTN